MTISTPLTRDALRRQDERELFEALDVGLRTAEASAGAIAYARQEGRWSLVCKKLGEIREVCDMLKNGRERPSLILPSGMDLPMGPGDREH